MNWPWNKKKPQKPSLKFAGMSNAGILPKFQKKPVKEEQKPSAPKRNIFQPILPYLAVIREDVKRLLRIDEEHRRQRELYNDFMEQHFGRMK